ncbi:MAG TPA: hypothetical protein VJM46_03455 [Candidatus Saccharimonadales bacterium]|nr:hypothetical protein [Candidatus Saccharimonadales bacterium]
MSEVHEPLPVMDRFVDSSEISERIRALKRARNLRSVAQLAVVSRMRAEAHAAANTFRDFYVGTHEDGAVDTAELRTELTEAETALARWVLMQEHDEFRTIDLARIENAGEWDATAGAEADIATIAAQLRLAGNGGHVIDRDVTEAKRRIMVDPGVVSSKGLIAIRRKRLMLATAPHDVVFRDMRPGTDKRVHGQQLAATSHVEIDKVSEFILDLDLLRRMHPTAAREVEAAVRGDAPPEITNHGRNLVSPRIVEAAIDVNHPLLTPAVTTYFADRKFKNIRPATDDSELEMASV